jgi:hypothetical protein
MSMFKGIGSLIIIFVSAILGGIVGCVAGMVLGPIRMIDVFNLKVPDFPSHTDQTIKDKL